MEHPAITDALAELERSTKEGIERLEAHKQRIKDASTVEELKALMPWLQDHA